MSGSETVGWESLLGHNLILGGCQRMIEGSDNKLPQTLRLNKNKILEVSITRQKAELLQFASIY